MKPGVPEQNLVNISNNASVEAFVAKEMSARSRNIKCFRPHSAQTILRQLVLDTLPSTASKRSYATALDSLFRFAASRPLTRAPLMEYWASIAGLAPSTSNVWLSAFRRMVSEAQKNGMP